MLNLNAQNFIFLSLMFLTLSKLLSMGTFKNYVGSRFPSFDSPPSPCSSLFIFDPPPPPTPTPQGTFALARTHPLPLNFYACEIQSKEINYEYQYLWLSSTCLLRRRSRISIKWTLLVHDKSVRFTEMSTLQRVHLKMRSLQK